MRAVRWVRTEATTQFDAALELLRDAPGPVPSPTFIVRVGGLIFDVDTQGDLEDLLDATPGLETAIYTKTTRNDALGEVVGDHV